MLIIFGWGRVTTKVLYLIGLRECQHCHRVSQWPYQRSRVWFTLFFIPCIPYKTTYWVGCPHCQYGYAVVDEYGFENQHIPQEIRAAIRERSGVTAAPAVISTTSGGTGGA